MLNRNDLTFMTMCCGDCIDCAVECENYDEEFECTHVAAKTALELLDKTEAQGNMILNQGKRAAEMIDELNKLNFTIFVLRTENEQLKAQNAAQQEEIRILREQLPENSERVITLPCNVGDTVYVDKDILWLGNASWMRFTLPKYIRCEVNNIRFTKKQKLIKVNPLIEESMGSRNYKLIPFSAIGKTVFVTLEDANKAIGGGQ